VDNRVDFLEKSKIRQDLMANAGYGFGALPAPANPDRFRVRVRERKATRIAYVRLIGGYDAEKILAGYRKLIGSVSMLPRLRRKLGGIRPGLLCARPRTACQMMRRFPYSPSKIGGQS